MPQLSAGIGAHALPEAWPVDGLEEPSPANWREGSPFRHSFATHLLEAGYDIRTVQDLRGRRHVKIKIIYTHVLHRGGLAVRSPLDKGSGTLPG